jgi:hypothetical protein
MTYKKMEARYEFPAELAAGLRTEALRVASRPEEFWSRQRIQIRSRMREQRQSSGRKLWLAVACAALLILAVLLTTPAKQPNPAAPVRAEIDPDQELLMAVEHAMASATPEALEPVALNVDTGLNHSESMIEKEKHNEN